MSAVAGPLKLRVEALDAGGSQGVVITDNAAGDLVSNTGVISFAGMVGGNALSISSGVSRQFTDPIDTAELDLNSLTLTFSGPGVIRLTLEDTDYSVGTNLPKLTAISNIGGTATSGVSLTAQSWVNPLNATPSLGANQGASGPLGAIGAAPAGSIAIFDQPFTFSGSGAFSASDFVTFAQSGVYSLFSQVYIKFDGPGTVSFDLDTLVPVPEPATLLLFGGGLVGLSQLGRRRLAASRR